MSIKVLVFESDAAFAGELRNELGKLGCSTCVVDDGSVGLQQASAERPDLILLSIELPRMNGFSVCNKLKKDAALKDVPLIIMSSESSDETFEQHRKLRTRAEDYVHKPIAFGELLQHIRTFVRMDDVLVDANGESDGIVIDDEIGGGGIDIEDGTMGGAALASQPPASLSPTSGYPPPASAGGSVDAEVDAFTESAFGMLQDAPVASDAPQTRDFNGAHDNGHDSLPTRPPPGSRQSIRVPAPSVAPQNDAELNRLRGEAERATSRIAELERDIAAANEKIAHIHEEADAEAERKQRELDELKTRLQQTAKGGGAVSSREFLDLREALNKKDKEILALKEAVSSKDREIFDGRDKSLAFERGQAEAEEKILVTERELAETREKVDTLTGQLAGATSTGDDLKQQLEKALGQIDAGAKELAELQRKHEDDGATHDAAVASLKEEVSQAALALTAAEARHKSAVEDVESRLQVELDEAEAKLQATIEQAQKDRDAALAKARAEADTQRAQAIGAREKELRIESDAKLAALHRAHQDELSRAKTDFAHQMETAKREAQERLTKRETELEGEAAAKQAELESAKETELAEAREKAESELADAQAKAASELAETQAKAASELADARAKAETELADTQAKAEAQLASAQASTAVAEERVAELGKELEAASRARSDVEDAKGASDAANEARISDLTERLDKAETARDAFEKEIESARERISALEIDLASTQRDLRGTRESLEDVQVRLESESVRLQKAISKWDADKTTLERAKDALAVALAQIDEVEARPIGQ